MPDQIIPPRRNQWLTVSGLPTHRFIEYLEHLADSGNSYTDQLEALEAISNVHIPNSSKQVTDLELLSINTFNPDIKATVITADYTTYTNEIILCNNSSSITVTLNTSPKNNERVSIKRLDNTVTVLGPIDGDTTKNIILKYDSPELIYNLTLDNWSII